jgi:hypothetical protein
MSTTGGTPEGTVLVLDDPKTIEKKIKRAVTDSGSEIVRAPDKPGVTNLIDILAVAAATTPAAVEEDMRSARGYGDLKAATRGASSRCWRRCASATPSCAATSAPRRDPRRRGREGPRDGARDAGRRPRGDGRRPPAAVAACAGSSLLVGAIVLVDTMFYAAITPLLPDLADELDLGKNGAGVLAGAYAAGTLIGALPGGWLARAPA